ncbi:MAG: epimerase [Alphaproteobacteria bacterium]|nr:epimerase [Alphaproteobacteria bacterium]|tara:strand:+ start:644 stop:1555 length:912 start_codon:yes stop_codon:yes gene_type:complete
MNIFITGATGYIGGTVAAKLMEAGHTITGLARNGERAALLNARGIGPVVGTLDDLDILADAARAADAVVNAANADHPFAARAITQALEGSNKVLLHTSGTSIVADNANGAAGGTVYAEDTPLDPLPEKASRVATDRMVVDAAARGVHAVVMCPCLIYGRGLGVRPDSIQVPLFIETARASGVPRHLGLGLNIWSNVHIEDCADAYVAALERAPAGSYFYVEAGEDSMLDLNRAVGRLLGLGEETETLPLAEAIRAWGLPMAHGMGSNVRVIADRARSVLGWAPSRAPLLDDIEHGSYRDALAG